MYPQSLHRYLVMSFDAFFATGFFTGFFGLATVLFFTGMVFRAGAAAFFTGAFPAAAGFLMTAEFVRFCVAAGADFLVPPVFDAGFALAMKRSPMRPFPQRG
jgi:hypothetical protein